MKFVCGPTGSNLPQSAGALNVVLYGQSTSSDYGSAGATAKAEIIRRKLNPAARAWDFLSIALAAVAADHGSLRNESSDGWTREIEIDVAVADPDFWRAQAKGLELTLAFLTTDRWIFNFHPGGLSPTPPKIPTRPLEDCVALLSGGLDSLIGAIDLVAAGKKPYAVSQLVRGDGEKQIAFATKIGGGLTHIQLNHVATTPGEVDNTQRARSLIFIAYAALLATTFKQYQDGAVVPLYICENGFIAINPPLTGNRLGSLSTRTAHPEFLGRLQQILTAAGLRVEIRNPYSLKTKGEMMISCSDQTVLTSLAAQSTSCGRYLRFGYKHCGRCVPCQVRRAAFLRSGMSDTTVYVYNALGKNDDDHARFDDVRSVAMAAAEVKQVGVLPWLGNALSSGFVTNKVAITDMLERGLTELHNLHTSLNVK